MKNPALHVSSTVHIRLCQLTIYSLKHITLSILFLLFAAYGVEGKTYVITTVAQGGLFDIGQRFLEEAYQGIGMEVAFAQLPAERALVNSNRGLVDAEIFCVDGNNEQYRNLLKVPISFISAENVVFSKSLNFHIKKRIQEV